MTLEEKLRAFPTKRIDPVDGMPVTAAVWREAHDYHRLQQQLHAMAGYGAGILAGMEVIASDPADSTVYIMPGVAIDPSGATILLTKPLPFNLGQAQGRLSLLMTYGESAPRSSEGDGDYSLFYVHTGYSLEAVSTLANTGPETNGVVVAEILRSGPDAPIRDAEVAAHPRADEIDLRFRREVGFAVTDIARVAVCYVGKASQSAQGLGMTRMAQAVKRPGLRVCVDDDVDLNEDLTYYTLVYLVGQKSSKLDAGQMDALYAYIQAGGTVFFEGNRRDGEADASAADAVFADLLESFGIQVEPLPEQHPLLSEPYLFAELPAGFEPDGAPELLIGEGVLFCKGGYGDVWRGAQHGQKPDRATIRAAHEWGENLIVYALGRQRKANAGA